MLLDMVSMDMGSGEEYSMVAEGVVKGAKVEPIRSVGRLVWTLDAAPTYFRHSNHPVHKEY